MKLFTSYRFCVHGICKEFESSQTPWYMYTDILVNLQCYIVDSMHRAQHRLVIVSWLTQTAHRRLLVSRQLSATDDS